LAGSLGLPFIWPFPPFCPVLETSEENDNIYKEGHRTRFILVQESKYSRAHRTMRQCTCIPYRPSRLHLTWHSWIPYSDGLCEELCHLHPRLAVLNQQHHLQHSKPDESNSQKLDSKIKWSIKQSKLKEKYLRKKSQLILKTVIAQISSWISWRQACYHLSKVYPSEANYTNTDIYMYDSQHRTKRAASYQSWV
jgi:hypothetical protein